MWRIVNDLRSVFPVLRIEIDEVLKEPSSTEKPRQKNGA